MTKEHRNVGISLWSKTREFEFECLPIFHSLIFMEILSTEEYICSNDYHGRASYCVLLLTMNPPSLSHV